MNTALAPERPLTDDELDRAFLALADPTRRAIIARLAGGEAGVLELAAPFSMSQPAVTKHLQVLESAGLVARRRDGRRRPARLVPGRLAQLADWVGGYREYWEAGFERLDGVLDELEREHHRRADGGTGHHPGTTPDSVPGTTPDTVPEEHR